MTTPGRTAPKAFLAISCVAALLIAISIPAATAAPGRGTARLQVPSQLDAAHFAEPLVAAGPTTTVEDQELLHAVAAYERRLEPDDFTSLSRFLSAHPQSAWRVALLTNLGLSYLHYGYFSRAARGLGSSLARRQGSDRAQAEGTGRSPNRREGKP
jgi:hypothetical protein